MKRKLFILILTFQVSTSCAQFLIKGRVLDDVDKPIPNATVELQHVLKSLTISTSRTDSSGSFVAQLSQNETTREQ